MTTNAQTYSELLHRPLSELSVEQVNQTMLGRLNEIRAEVKLKPLKYSDAIEKVAFYFMDHKTQWFQADGHFVTYCHFDDAHNGIIDRYKLFDIECDQVIISEKHYKSGKMYNRIKTLGGENVITTNGSVFELCEVWRKSPSHWAHISQKHYTHIGIAHRKDFPVLICDFIKFKDTVNLTE